MAATTRTVTDLSSTTKDGVGASPRARTAR